MDCGLWQPVADRDRTQGCPFSIPTPSPVNSTLFKIRLSSALHLPRRTVVSFLAIRYRPSTQADKSYHRLIQGHTFSHILRSEMIDVGGSAYGGRDAGCGWGQQWMAFRWGVMDKCRRRKQRGRASCWSGYAQVIIVSPRMAPFRVRLVFPLS